MRRVFSACVTGLLVLSTPLSCPADDTLRAAARYLTRDHSRNELVYFLWMIGIIALLGMAVTWYDRVRSRLRPSLATPATLFRELCQAHGLSRSDRRLLYRVAQQAGQPAFGMVFVDPRYLQSAIAHDADHADRLRRLYQQLFVG